MPIASYLPSLTLAAALVPQALQAADIREYAITSDGEPFVVVEGEILRGDANRFEMLVRRLNDPVVFLNSEGGVVADALRMGVLVRELNLDTAVTREDVCLSACALVWVAGDTRYLSVQGRVGTHAAYINDGDTAVASGIGNAEIGAYLARLGLSDAAVRYFTVAAPDEMMDLTPDLARIVGIDAVFLDLPKVSSEAAPPRQPEVSPAPPEPNKSDILAAAQNFAAYALISSTCAPLFNPDQESLRAGREALARQEADAQFANFASAESAALALEINTRGVLDTCLVVETHLRDRLLPTGIHGPSFTCPPDALPAESTICADHRLWAKDRAMNAIYLMARGFQNDVGREAILADQRAWLNHRNACGANADCISSSYKQRFGELSDLLRR